MIKKRHAMSKKTIKALKEEVLSLYPSFPLADFAEGEEVHLEDAVVYIIAGLPALVRRDRLFPSLRALIERGFSWLPSVGIDRGATKAMMRGADLMLPGIREVAGDFQAGSTVVAYDVDTRAPIMVGEALMSSEQVRAEIGKGKGRAVKSLHYVGDRLWETISSL